MLGLLRGGGLGAPNCSEMLGSSLSSMEEGPTGRENGRVRGTKASV